MMITALKKKTAVAPLARSLAALKSFSSLTGLLEKGRGGGDEEREKREGACSTAHPKAAAFPPSLAPSLSSPRLLLSLCWSQQKQHCSTEKAKTYTCCMEPRRTRRIEARRLRLAALPAAPPFRFARDGTTERMKRKGRMTREGGEKAGRVNTSESVPTDLWLGSTWLAQMTSFSM